MTSYNLNNKRFIPVDNKFGLSSGETIFEYQQEGDLITGTYAGGAIIKGSIVGKQITPSRIELIFQCLTAEQELKTGESFGTISKNEEGKLCLQFDWRWLNGDRSGGQSEYIEIK